MPLAHPPSLQLPPSLLRVGRKPPQGSGLHGHLCQAAHGESRASRAFSVGWRPHVAICGITPTQPACPRGSGQERGGSRPQEKSNMWQGVGWTLQGRLWGDVWATRGLRAGGIGLKCRWSPWVPVSHGLESGFAVLLGSPQPPALAVSRWCFPGWGRRQRSECKRGPQQPQTPRKERGTPRGLCARRPDVQWTGEPPCSHLGAFSPSGVCLDHPQSPPAKHRPFVSLAKGRPWEASCPCSRLWAQTPAERKTTRPGQLHRVHSWVPQPTGALLPLLLLTGEKTGARRGSEWKRPCRTNLLLPPQGGGLREGVSCLDGGGVHPWLGARTPHPVDNATGDVDPPGPHGARAGPALVLVWGLGVWESESGLAEGAPSVSCCYGPASFGVQPPPLSPHKTCRGGRGPPHSGLDVLSL